MDFSLAEENYLKAIYHLAQASGGVVNTNAIAEEMATTPASVTDMLKRLAGKNALHHIKYKGVTMTEEGEKTALWLIRKHRLWEVFLVEKLKFTWDEVHEVAEQLEHIQSKRMIESLDEFLGFPQFDPHGDPIPDRNGKMPAADGLLLCEAHLLESLKVVAVKDTRSTFLKYLDKLGIGIGTHLKVIDRVEFDESLEIEIEGARKALVSKQISYNLLIVKA